MSIVKALALFILTSLIVFAISNFLPEYHPVQKEQLESLLKQINYTEGQENTTDIDNVLDTIPINVAILYKGKVISSNVNKGSRVAEGEKILPELTKNIPFGDFSLNYKEDNSSDQYAVLLIPLFTGLICGGIFFFLNRSIETTGDSTQSMREDIERLQTMVAMYQQKDDEYSRTLDKSIPDNIEDAKKLLKSMIKEKEAMLNEIEKFKESEDELHKDINNGKMQLTKQKEIAKELENKIRELQSQLSSVARQEKHVEDLKSKNEALSADIKDFKVKLKSYEKTDIDGIKIEISDLRIKLIEAETQIKAGKEEIKALKKIDGEKLQAALETETQEKEELKVELKEIKQQLKVAMSGLDEADTDQIKLENIEYQKTIKSLQKELKVFQETALQSLTQDGEDSVKIDNIKNQLKEKVRELDDLRYELKASREMADSLKSGISSDQLSSLEDKVLVNSLKEKIKILEEELNNKSSDSSDTSAIEELLKEKDEQISDMQKQIINRELQVKRLKSGEAPSTAMDVNIEALEADLQKSKSLALKYKKERDDKIKNTNTLSDAFESANETLRRKEEELSLIDEKYNTKISEIRAQMESQTSELSSLNDKYRHKIDELKALVDNKTEEINHLKGLSDARIDA